MTRLEQRSPTEEVRRALSARSPVLDGFRGLVVLFLVLGHYLTSLPRSSLLGQISLPVGYSITALFVFSGLCLTWGMAEEFESTGGISVRAFYSRKLARIYPTLLAFTAVTTAHHTLNGIDVPPLRIAALLGQFVNYYNALAVTDFTRHNVGHLWSIAVGAQFFLVWPFLLERALRLKREELLVVLLASVVVASPLVRALVLPELAGPAYRYNATEARIGEVALGALTALLLRRADFCRIADRVIRERPLTLATMATLLLTLSAPEAFTSTVGSGLNAILTGILLVSVLARTTSGSRRVLEFKPFVLLGAVSYSLFVWHWYGFAVGQALGRGSTLVGGVLGIPSTVAVAVAAYLMLERPLLKRWRREAAAISRPF